MWQSPDPSTLGFVLHNPTATPLGVFLKTVVPFSPSNARGAAAEGGEGRDASGNGLTSG